MKSIVLDASVALKLFFQEEHSDLADRVVRRAHTLHAPDLIWAETANVVWKRHRNGEILAGDAATITHQILQLPLQICESHLLVQDALALAIQWDRTVYDCLYLALAVRINAVMVTGDKRLVRALAGSPLEKHVAWIGGKP